MQTTLVLNPAAAAGKAARLLQPIQQRLGGLGVEHQVELSAAPGDVARLCQRAIEAGSRRLLVAGGDGSMYEAANGMVRAGRSDVQLNPIPIGTGNDFTKMLGLKPDWDEACERVVSGKARQIDVGQLQTESGLYYFLNGVGVGFDAEVTKISRGLKHLPAPYYLALLKGWLAGVTPRQVTVGAADNTYQGAVTLCAITNGQFLGGSFHIAPTAAIDDGQLDVVIADHLSRIGVLKVLPALFAARHLDSEPISHWQCPEVTIAGDSRLPLHVDGELIAPAKSLKVTVLPHALTVVA